MLNSVLLLVVFCWISPPTGATTIEVTLTRTRRGYAHHGHHPEHKSSYGHGKSGGHSPYHVPEGPYPVRPPPAQGYAPGHGQGHGRKPAPSHKPTYGYGHGHGGTRKANHYNYNSIPHALGHYGSGGGGKKAAYPQAPRSNSLGHAQGYGQGHGGYGKRTGYKNNLNGNHALGHSSSYGYAPSSRGYAPAHAYPYTSLTAVNAAALQATHRIQELDRTASYSFTDLGPYGGLGASFYK